MAIAALKKIIQYTLVLSCVFILSACTTVTNKSKGANKEKALATYEKLAIKYLNQGDRDSARFHIGKAFAIDSSSTGAHLAQALLFEMEGEFSESEKHFKKALRNKKQVSIRFNYAGFLMRRERYKACFEQFEKVAEDYTYGKRSDALSYSGLCAQKLKNPVKARAAFLHALNLNPNQAIALLEMAEITFISKEYEKSRQFLDSFEKNAVKTSRSLWLAIRLEKIFGNVNNEASYALQLKNMHPYSKEYLQYKRLMVND